jgi:hypothetical protein
VLIEPSPEEKQMTVTALDPMKGRGKVLRTIEKGPSGWALSPDGSILAVRRPGEAQVHIGLFSLSGGPDREITVKGWPNALGLDWSSSSKGLYVGSVSPQNRTLLYGPAGTDRLMEEVCDRENLKEASERVNE